MTLIFEGGEMATITKENELFFHTGATQTTLQSKAAVILRAQKELEDPYYKSFSDNGFQSINFLPVLHYEHINREELRSELMNSDKYSGLVFTSGTAVEECVSSLTQQEREKVIENWYPLPVFTVGKATAQAVAEGLGLSPTGSHSGNAEILSRQIIEYFFNCTVPSKPLLFPCAAMRRDTLPTALEKAGIPLKCLVCYETKPHPRLQDRLVELSQQLEDVKCVWVVFFSPSGVSFALEHVRRAFKSRLKVAAIGGTTGNSLSKAGKIPDAIAKQPNSDSLVTAIHSTML